MVSGTLYTYPDNFRAYKALIAAQYSGAQIKLAPNFVFNDTNKTDAFLKKFPAGKVPAFETADGQCLSDSNAIAYYVSNSQLRGGKCELNQAQILQWICFADTEILPASCAWIFPILGILPPNKQQTERAKEDVKKVLSVLNTHLKTKTYLVGERITLADIIVACTLLNLYQHVLDGQFRNSYSNTNRWFNTIINQPQFKAVVKDFKICNKMAEVDPKKYQEIQAQLKGGDACAKPEKVKKEKQPKEPKEPKPKAAPEPEEMEEDPALVEPPSKDPFDALPKGTFNMDDFKRVYSNEAESVSIKYFWDKFDPENYSIWYGEYKYPEELTKVFMSCNLIGGMHQRLDKMRKASFGSCCLFGEDNNSSISGVWVWRGQDLAFTLSPDWQIDYETYDWKKLDPKDEDTKKLVTQYFSWTGTDKQGRKFNQGKIFK